MVSTQSYFSSLFAQFAYFKQWWQDKYLWVPIYFMFLSFVKALFRLLCRTADSELELAPAYMQMNDQIVGLGQRTGEHIKQTAEQ